MNSKKVVGQVLLWAGFFGAAFLTVLKTEVDGSKWSTVPWLGYVIFMAVGIAGVVLLRIASAASETNSQRVEAEYSTVTDSLNALLDRIASLREQLGSLKPLEIVDFIDGQLAEPFANFADARNALTRRFGLQGFADVMTQFASGERFVNRSWSAAADGYVNEVASSLERAEGHLIKANELIQQMEKTTPA